MNIEKIRDLFINNPINGEGMTQDDLYIKKAKYRSTRKGLVFKINYPIKTRSSDTPYFHNRDRYIAMVPVSWFSSPSKYYRCLFHELVHSTMFACGREGWKHENYREEECIADIGCAMLMDHFGFNVDTTILGYISIYKKRMTFFNLNKYVIEAEKACKYLIENNIIERKTA